MSVFNSKTITNAGMNLIAQGMAGGSINFKSILLGSGTFTGQDMANQTDLVKVENTLAITGVNRNGSTVSLTATLTPQQIQNDYAWSELGVIAEGATGGDILYLYGHTAQTSTISRNGLDEKIIQVTLLVSNVQNVTATVDNSLVYLTQAELNNHNTGNQSHADIRQALEQVRQDVANIDVSWNAVTGKPQTFPPSTHKHSTTDITGLPTSLPANGGNADTVDGLHAEAFPLKSQGYGGNAPIWNGGNLDDLPVGIYTTRATGVPEINAYHIVMCIFNDVSAGKFQIAMSQSVFGNRNDRRGVIYTRTCVQNTWSSWSHMDGTALGYSDARNEGNKPPVWYVTNKRTGLTLELNSGTANGMPSSGMYHVVTTLPWYDTTGGVVQTAIHVDGVAQYTRGRVNDTTWSAWSKTPTSADLDSLKQSVGDGKNAIATAITGKGVQASGSDTFSVLANKVSSLKVPTVKSEVLKVIDLTLKPSSTLSAYSSLPQISLTSEMVKAVFTSKNLSSTVTIELLDSNRKTILNTTIFGNGRTAIVYYTNKDTPRSETNLYIRNNGTANVTGGIEVSYHRVDTRSFL